MRKYVSLALLAAGLVLVLVTIPFATSSIRVPYSDCGTVFAGEDTWTYEKQYDEDLNSYLSSSNRYSTTGIAQAGESAIDGLLRNMQLGSDAFDACKEAHHDRRVLLGSLLGPAALLIVVGTVLFAYSRSNRQLQEL